MRRISLCLLGLLVSSLVGEISFSQGSLKLVVDRGDPAWLKAAMLDVKQVQRELEEFTGLRWTDSLTIHFYFSRRRARQALPRAPEWSGGLATGAHAVAIYGATKSHWRRILRHELVHALLAQNKVQLPVWFNEGLAQVFAGQDDWKAHLTLSWAAIRNRLIPLEDLESVLKYNPSRAELAYAEAASAVQFFLKRYGSTAVPYLLTLPDRDFTSRFRKTAWITPSRFEVLWRKHMYSKAWLYRLARFPDLLWLIMPLLVVIAYFVRRRRQRRKLHQWEMEETQGTININFEQRPKSHYYDGWLYRWFLDPGLAPLRRAVKKRIPEGSRVIEAGCGTGDQLFHLADIIAGGVGIELSPRNIKVARKEAENNGWHHLQFLLANAAHLPQFQDGNFDVALSTLALHEMSPQVRSAVLREMRRLARRMILVDWSAPAPGKWSAVQMHLVEFFAGWGHYRNYRDYLAAGGGRFYLEQCGWEIRDEQKLLQGRITLWDCFPAEHTFGADG